MAEFIKIAVLDNELQARYLEALLKEQEIPHRLHSYHDSAYDGVFQNLKGWGHVEAPAEYQTEISEIIKEINTEPPHEEA